ncbi:helix-turn-helix domain-containing protein [Ralstonia pseudosolanacearum]
MSFPRTQSELLRQARGKRTQKDFAAYLGVDKTCLSRYEAGKLGAPARVVDVCLALVADQLAIAYSEKGVQEALQSARKTVALLEGAAESDPG